MQNRRRRDAYRRIFRVLGISPMLGREFRAGSDAAGKNHESVLSYAFWQRDFGGRHDAIGKTMRTEQ